MATCGTQGVNWNLNPTEDLTRSWDREGNTGKGAGAKDSAVFGQLKDSCAEGYMRTCR